MEHSPPRLTAAELLALPEDGKRHELIDGEHFVSAAPTLRHQLVSGNVFVAIRLFVRPRNLGEVFYAPLDVLLSDHDLVEPDIVYVSRERFAIMEERLIRGAPDLAVEVLSPSTRRLDTVLKRRAYRKFGFAEYWMIDPKPETIEVFRGREWLWPTLRLVRGEGPQVLTSPLFPGFELGLEQVFE